MAMDATRIPTSLSAATSSTPIAEVHAALSDAISLAGYVSEMVNRMAGAQAPNSTETKQSPEKMGVLWGMADHANEAKLAIRLAHGQLDRLEKLL